MNVRRAAFARWFLCVLAALFTFSFITACTPEEDTDCCAAPTEEDEDDHGHEDEEDVFMVPNNDAVITIVSPQSGTSFASGEDIVVVVEIENFDLNVGGSHWHLQVDGVAYGMVVGNVLQQVVRNLEPGEHTITAHLSLGTHEELEDYSEITINVAE